MSYSPSNVPTNPADLSRFIAVELEKIRNEFTLTGDYDVLHSAPDKPQVGMVRWADGSDWNPGSGEGLYEYRTTGWSKL